MQSQRAATENISNNNIVHGTCYLICENFVQRKRVPMFGYQRIKAIVLRNSGKKSYISIAPLIIIN
jgi:hypothetical protein